MKVAFLRLITSLAFSTGQTQSGAASVHRIIFEISSGSRISCFSFTLGGLSNHIYWRSMEKEHFEVLLRS